MSCQIPNEKYVVSPGSGKISHYVFSASWAEATLATRRSSVTTEGYFTTPLLDE
jgi:hypothetical protein